MKTLNRIRSSKDLKEVEIKLEGMKSVDASKPNDQRGDRTSQDVV